MKKELPIPTIAEVEHYLAAWDKLEDYTLQEKALNKLFHEVCPENKKIEDILIKCSTLNDFYSTNIFKVFPVAKHILLLKIDDRLNIGDLDLVNKIAVVEIPTDKGKVKKNFYSFATKYCSHHNKNDYPIFDSYVDKVLRHFRNRNNDFKFKNDELKNYARFIEIIKEFQSLYGLEQYTLKEIDKYLWQLGKKFFNRYKK